MFNEYNNKCTILTIITFIWCMQMNSESTQQDFSEAAKSKRFVDKTSFVGDFLRGNRDSELNVKVITAPKGFGKSTVVDMVKRFFQIQVYAADGEAVNYKNNTNYNLFCRTPLNICQNNNEFIEKHFGQRPVIHISFSPLGNVTDLKSFHRATNEIIRDAYSKHNYLLNEDVTPPLYSLTKQAFRKIIVRKVAVDEAKYFRKLAEILHDYFGAKAIILLDDYDALGHRESADYVEIVSLLNRLSSALFKSNQHVSNALITGERCVKDTGLSPSLKDFAEYRFVGHNYSSRYRGFIKTIDIDGM